MKGSDEFNLKLSWTITQIDWLGYLESKNLIQAIIPLISVIIIGTYHDYIV